MTKPDYKLSFTAGNLFRQEAVKILQLYVALRDWDAVRADALANNTLQTRTRSSAVRLVREVIQRVQSLTAGQADILLNGTRQEQNQILWLAVCKQYRLAAEFAREVIREKFLHMDLALSYLDYNIFFNAKAEWHPGLEQLTARTKNDLRQVLFRMLRESEIISATNQIQPLILSEQVANVIFADDPAWLDCFPVSDAGIRRQASSLHQDETDDR